MATMNLQIDPVELRAALGEFRQYQADAELIRRTVDGSIRGIGASWYGEARIAYDNTINTWLGEYQTQVNAPLERLIAWFESMIQIMENTELQNTQL